MQTARPTQDSSSTALCGFAFKRSCSAASKSVLHRSSTCAGRARFIPPPLREYAPRSSIARPAPDSRTCSTLCFFCALRLLVASGFAAVPALRQQGGALLLARNAAARALLNSALRCRFMRSCSACSMALNCHGARCFLLAAGLAFAPQQFRALLFLRASLACSL